MLWQQWETDIFCDWRYLGEEHFRQGEQGEQRPRGGMYLGILMPVDWARVSQGDLGNRGQGGDYMRHCGPEQGHWLTPSTRRPHRKAVMQRSNVI